MSDPHSPSDRIVDSEKFTVESVFDVDSTDPYDLLRTVHGYLSQEVRHNILQVIIGHPKHLVSVTEFNYYLSESRSTIREQLENFVEHKILTQYHHELNAASRDIPAEFWGLTPFGISLLSEYRYLRSLPVMRAVHDATHKPETVLRHEKAPRPPLPDAVRSGLNYDELDPDDSVPEDECAIGGLREETLYVDAVPADPSILNEDANGNRTLDELFSQ